MFSEPRRHGGEGEEARKAAGQAARGYSKSLAMVTHIAAARGVLLTSRSGPLCKVRDYGKSPPRW